MDPTTLEQLLDCPICFEQLDETNRVLPCQHTFCQKCLETVKSKYSELRCPECRTKYNGSMQELPCNIFVIRILEQLKQVEKKAQSVKYNTSKTTTRSSSSSKPIISHPLHIRESQNESTTESTQASSIIDSMSRLVIRDRPEPVSDPFDIGFTSNIQRNAARISQNSVNLPDDLSRDRRILKAVRKLQANDAPQRRISSSFCAPTAISSSSQPRTENTHVEKPSFNVNSSFSFSVELRSRDRSMSHCRGRGRRRNCV